MSSSSQYAFFDIGLDLELPHDVRQTWDLLYGSFRRKHRSGVRSIHRAAYLPTDDSWGEWSVDGTLTRVRRDAVLATLQEFVQNQILRSVESHLVWHGAAWLVEGQPVLLLAESGVGKSTLSLGHAQRQGVVVSDEIAACDIENLCVAPFPRSMALRPRSASICGCAGSGTPIQLEEPKLIVALPPAPDIASLRATTIAILEWAVDASELRDRVVEMRLIGAVRTAIAALRARDPSLSIEPHPDGGDWLRLTGCDLPAQEFERIVKQSGCQIAGFRRHAARRPDYQGAPVLDRISPDAAARVAMAHLLNARRLVERYSAPYVMGLVREVMQRATCCRMVPGELTQSLAAVYRAAQSVRP